MAQRRRSKPQSARTTRTSHVEKLRYLSKRGVRISDPTNTRAVAQKYRQVRDPKNYKYRSLRGVPPDMIRKATPKQKAEARSHGFHVTPKGVVIDGPRDRRRNPIKGARTKVHRGGVVSQSVGQRRDFIYGFTKAEKKKFAKDPAAMEKEILARLRKMFPTLAKSRKPQIRLQWGAYQATKDFAPSYFTARYFATISPEETRKVGKKKAKPRIDKLTGFHIVIHVPKKKAKRQHGRKKK